MKSSEVLNIIKLNLFVFIFQNITTFQQSRSYSFSHHKCISTMTHFPQNSHHGLTQLLETGILDNEIH